VPMKLLARLCAAEGPTEVFDQDEIDKLSVLRSAALVEARYPSIARRRWMLPLHGTRDPSDGDQRRPRSSQDSRATCVHRLAVSVHGGSAIAVG
jgi:hypothetical protein